jgi:hypothetical protein
MSAPVRPIFNSSNGDSWSLCRNDGRIVVLHTPNGPSGGKQSYVDLSTFLAEENRGPEHQALRQLIGELIEPRRLQAEFDDHD